ncbi:LexA-binding, inner membrane-associated putative hydrolase [Halorubrum aquaticum]|uniref:LexA-binding, inner membrane-associated putative hydrolase n=1 Tax=Halorubrum aquaticum TaxID=387340 RepID=A0A1I3A328_9EURY|nr:metal-dependent hydrolase [Halorubrum aquaticum]SFH44517.1 LexA-binding, inner membrane-associated putative hydrolase [Halorubrum aquaticum]
MVSSIVHAGFALVLAAGLLKGSYDRRALAVVLAVVLLPEADSFLGPIMSGAHRTVGHNFVFPAAAAFLIYYDTRIREESAIRERVADRGVRIAWVALFVHLFAHVSLDWAHLDGVNVLWPLHDSFFRLEGELLWSSADGLVQTFVDIDLNPETGDRRVDAGSTGTTQSVHVNNPVEPDDPETLEGAETIDRRFPVAGRGWRLYLLGLGVFTVVARRLQSDPPAESAE